MSLSIELHQIQLASWLAEEEAPKAKPYGIRLQAGARKREAVLKAVKAIGRADCAALMDYLGFTRQSVIHAANTLAESGELRKIITTDRRVFFDVA